MTLFGWHIGWWPVYLAISAALAVISEGRQRAALLWIIFGLLAVQVWKVIELGDMIWVAFAATWVFVAGAIWRHSATICALTLLSVMCYAVGRMNGAAFAAGDPVWVSPLFWADMALVAAISTAGGRGVSRIFADSRARLADLRRGDLGWNNSGRGLVARSGSLARSEKGQTGAP